MKHTIEQLMAFQNGRNAAFDQLRAVLPVEVLADIENWLSDAAVRNSEEIGLIVRNRVALSRAKDLLYG